MIPAKDSSEFLGQIIDVFDDFLSDRSIRLDKRHCEVGSDEPIIYGNNYDELEFMLSSLMDEWGIINKCDIPVNVTIVIDGGDITDICMSKDLAEAVDFIDVINLDTTDPVEQEYNSNALKELNDCLLIGTQASIY